MAYEIVYPEGYEEILAEKQKQSMPSQSEQKAQEEVKDKPVKYGLKTPSPETKDTE